MLILSIWSYQFYNSIHYTYIHESRFDGISQQEVKSLGDVYCKFRTFLTGIQFSCTCAVLAKCMGAKLYKLCFKCSSNFFCNNTSHVYILRKHDLMKKV